jgi:hypothetical protein
MATWRPSLPSKMLGFDNVRPNEQTTVYMAPDGSHLVECSLYVMVIIIESFLITLCALRVRELLCIR